MFLQSHTHRQDVVLAGRGELLGGHQARLGLDEELAVLVALLDAVGDLGVGPLVTVRGDHPVHRVPPGGSLSLWSLPLRQLDLVDLLQKQWPVVVLVEHLDDDSHGGGLGRDAVVGDGDLRGDEAQSERLAEVTRRLTPVSVGQRSSTDDQSGLDH